MTHICIITPISCHPQFTRARVPNEERILDEMSLAAQALAIEERQCRERDDLEGALQARCAIEEMNKFWAEMQARGEVI